MIRSFYNASSGLIYSQKGLDITANNVANVSTTAYQTEVSSFADLLYTNINGVANAANTQPGAQTNKISDVYIGNGTKLAKTDTVFSEGPLEQTNRNLDYAITGDGFFAVKTSKGVEYTRDGNFHLSKQGDGSLYLASAQGGFVLDAQGHSIKVTDPDKKLNIGVYVFQNQDSLKKVGNNLYIPTDSKAKAINNQDSLKQGFLENSTVDLAKEMSDMIVTERTFGLNAKMVQISDEVMQTINNLR